jgi:heme exporter protein A
MTLVANALACERNGRVVFSGLSFAVEAGRCAELRGPNGAGKSTLLRLLAGLLPAAHGTVSLSDGGTAMNPVPPDHAPLAQRLHLIAHQDAMKPQLTVSENLEFWCAMLGGSGMAKALAAFNLEGLRHEPAAILSAGQRRRLALSRLFLVERPLWLLDEPATALDSDSQAVLRGHLTTHLAAGGIILLATHDSLLDVAHSTISLTGQSGPAS